MYKSFKAMDTNGDGKISKQELLAGYVEIYKERNLEDLTEEVEKIFK